MSLPQPSLLCQLSASSLLTGANTFLFFVFYYFMNFLCIIEGKDLTDVGSILMKVFLHAGYITASFFEKELV